MIDADPAKTGRNPQIWGAGLALVLFCLVLGDSYAAQQTQRVPKEGAIPRFKDIELLKIDGKVLGDNDKIMFGSPEFADWDGDGKTDLILGYWAMWSIGPRRGAGDGGKVRFYRNVSKTDMPQYKDMGDLECHGGLVRLAEA